MPVITLLAGQAGPLTLNHGVITPYHVLAFPLIVLYEESFSILVKTLMNNY